MKSAPRTTGLQRPGAALGLTTAVAVAVFATQTAAAAEASVRTSSRGRDVTIIAGEDRIVYEIRQNGVLRQIRIVPDIGRPYYLVPADPTRAGDDLSTVGRLVPSWKLIEF